MKNPMSASAERLIVSIANGSEPLAASAPKCPPRSTLEAPPWLLTTGEQTRCYVTTADTFCIPLDRSKSLCHDDDCFRLDAAYLVSDDTLQRGAGRQLAPEELDPSRYWGRQYYGVFTAHLMSDPRTGQQRVVAIMHGENKNEIIGRYQYENTVLPPRQYTKDQYSGYGDDNSYRDYWPGYFAFVAMTFCPLSANDGNDLLKHDQGPILWPARPYVDRDTDEASSQGLRHPSSIIHDGYLYVFYVDESDQLIRAARSPVEAMARPGSFMNYHDGSFGEPSLPPGFDRADRTFFYQPGGRSTPILDQPGIRFSVAKAAGTEYFVAVEERCTDKGVGIYLRASLDLVHWNEGTLVPDTTFPTWNEGTLHYPCFVNREFTSNTEIDLSGFYIIGTNHVNGTKLISRFVQAEVQHH